MPSKCLILTNHLCSLTIGIRLRRLDKAIIINHYIPLQADKLLLDKLIYIPLWKICITGFHSALALF